MMMLNLVSPLPLYPLNTVTQLSLISCYAQRTWVNPLFDTDLSKNWE